MDNTPLKIHFHAADTKEAQTAFDDLQKLYGQVSPDNAEAIVALGGDGTLLRALHEFYEKGTPIYGMDRGSVGFLLNPYNEKNLYERLNGAQKATLHPLRMEAQTKDGQTVEALAFNEVSLFRQSGSAAKIRISVNDVERLPELIADGVLVATPGGSTAYNFSAKGPIIPLSGNLLALTPLNPFRPRHWPGALIHHESIVSFDILEKDKRSVSATADFKEVRDVTHVNVKEARNIGVTLLFDPDHHLEEKIMKEQFLP